MNAILNRTKKLERKIAELAKLPEPYVDYEFDKLTTEELKEVVYGLEEGTITEERFNEIMDPVKFISRDPNSVRMRISRLPDEELEEMIDRYGKIIKN